MKVQALVAAVALAFGVSAFGQATPATPAKPAMPATPGVSSATPATPAVPATPAAAARDDKAAKDMTKADAKADAKATKKAAKSKAKSTASMGMGPASPVTDLDAGARQARIDAAYANWLAMQRR